jgi:5-formyltetrahydrofolate cyclo-ligase
MRPAKKERRSYYRQLQMSFPLGQFEAWNRLLAPKLLSLLDTLPENSYLAVYRARPREASLEALFQKPFRFCFPKVLSTDGQMEFRWVKNPLDISSFATGPWDILEPLDTNPVVEKEKMSAGFLPLLAFDDHGSRLGHGKGFYDRFLDHFPGLKIGVAFEWQFSPTPLPTELHDHFLDVVVTESTIRRCH